MKKEIKKTVQVVRETTAPQQPEKVTEFVFPTFENLFLSDINNFFLNQISF